MRTSTDRYFFGRGWSKGVRGRKGQKEADEKCAVQPRAPTLLAKASLHQLGEDWNGKRSSECVCVCMCDDGAAATKEREEETHLLVCVFCWRILWWWTL